MPKIIRFFVLLIGINLCFVESYAASRETPLTLSDAIRLAIAREPILKQTEANANALEQQSIANGQLPDPKLGLGINNVPANHFSLTQNDMTMTEVGISQHFPAGHSLAHKLQQTKNLALAEKERKNEQAATLLKNVSTIWLELYYVIQASNITKSNEKTLKDIVRATKSQYATGKANQSAVLEAQLEAAGLQDKEYQLKQQIDSLRATLSGWIGDDAAKRSLPTELPGIITKPLISVRKDLLIHPLLKQDNANIEAAKEEIALSKDQYIPDFDVGAGYGLRQGTDASGMKRSNFMSAQISMDLPIFTAKRQDKSLEASKDKFVAAELDRQIHYRNLSSDLTSQYANFQRLSEREIFYNQNIIPKAKQNIQVVLKAYQSSTTDLTMVLRAYSLIANLKLEELRIAVDKRKAQVNINYFAGVSK